MALSYGMFQGDVVIRTAIIYAFRDLKKNPWLLDFVFASLAYDELTKNEYGQKEIDKAKAWFLATEIPVVAAYRIDDPHFPCISVALLDASEAENTLGDTHYDTSEVSTQELPSVATVLSVASYTQFNGLLAAYVDKPEFFSTAMSLVDKTGRRIPIVAIPDADPVQQPDGSWLVELYVANGTIADFRGAIIKQNVCFYNILLESANAKETYVLGCHVQGDAYKLIYLHSILCFALSRYKERLFEGRGFERSSFSSSDIQRNPSFEEEVVLSRFVTINGYVKNFWPKDLVTPIAAVATRPAVVGGAKYPNATGTDPAWIGDEDSQDSLGGIAFARK